MAKSPQTADARAARPGNQVALLSKRRRLLPYALSVVAGIVAAAVFVPLEWSWLSWVMLVPLLMIQQKWERNPWLLAYAFGLGHYTATFLWLRTIFILAPFGLALICACFPAVWLGLAAGAMRHARQATAQDLQPKAGKHPASPRPFSPGWQVTLVLLLASAWVGAEWVRGWIFTGFPWNLLGVSQWRHSYLLPLTRLTGVHGISFLIVAVNVGLFLATDSWRHRATLKGDAKLPFGLLTGLLLLIVPAFAHGIYRLPDTSETVRIAAVQGNIPQIRVFNEDQLTMALNVYLDYTRDIVQREHPDLVVWPETAVPASLLNDPQCWAAVKQLLKDTRTPMILGSVYYRWPPGVKEQDAYRVFNSALYFDAQGELIDYYDKIQIVPFGEFVPLGDYFPWLVDLIGMGRGLTRGKDHTVFALGNNTQLGMMICYEDIFPWIARGSVLRGANVLLTITNDAWYWQTAGSRQHMINSVFRAVETMRPMFRSGNNSDTCLIMPDGQILDPLIDPETGSPFVRRAGVYNVPVYQDLPLTFYVRYGNVFAVICFIVTVGLAGWQLYRYFSRKKRQFEAVNPSIVP